MTVFWLNSFLFLGKIFVAKQPNVINEKKKFFINNGWRVSFSLHEKEKLKNYDEKDKGCRKQVVRFVKGLTGCDPTLKGITSYYWKNILFHLTDNEAFRWESEYFTERVFQMIWLMAKLVEYKKLPLYFNPQVNLFYDMEDKVSERISTRLMSLYRNEDKFDKVFRSVIAEAQEFSENNEK